jgi:spore coat protein U-like protein
MSVAVLVCASGAPAIANTANGPLPIALAVQKGCEFTVGRMDFGQVGLFTPTIDQTTPLSVRCTANVPFTLSLDGGQSFASNTRQMKRLTGFFPPALPYTLFKDAGRTTLWAPGDTVAGNSGSTGTVNLQIYGRVTGLTLTLGTYSDTVVVTFSF